MNNIFVTGGSGFLGGHLVKKLKSNKMNFVIAPNSGDCNLVVTNSLNRFEKKFDYIYHLAAWTQAGDFCLHFPGDQWIINQQINTNVLQWWKKYQPTAKLIFMGTSCSYSNNYPLIENNYLKGEPIDSLYTYAMTKRMLLIGAESLRKQFNMKYLCVVPSTLYGPCYHDDGRQMHFIFDLVRKIYNASNGGEAPKLWGDGYQSIEIIHVDDFICALLDVTDKLSNEIINIGAGEAYTIRNFADMIATICSYNKAKIIYDTHKYVGAKNKCLNIDKLRSMHTEFKIKNLKEGLKEIIEWYASTTSYKNQ